MTVQIRPERPKEIAAIHELVRSAFDRDLEADLVDALRAGDTYLPDLALVAVEASRIVGHIMITKLVIARDGGNQLPSTLLAPLAVLPSHQNRGIGMHLTRTALACARELGHASMILIGHPNYYPRFGFRPASTWGLRYAKPIPDDVFMAVKLVPDALTNAVGVVTLPPIFDEADWPSGPHRDGSGRNGVIG
jgi:putative acetyltransferase